MKKTDKEVVSIQKKHAMLIMAHNQFSILEKLIQMLDDERNDLYIHIDRKSCSKSEAYYRSLCRRSRVFFIPRMRLYWGHSSLVDCELALLKAALASGEDYAYLHLLSGVDLQIKPTEEIHRFFDEHPQNQFIALRNVYSGLGGMRRYYFFMPLRFYSKILYKGLDLVSAFIQRLLRVDRLKGANYAICKSQQWFSITADCAAYVVSQEDFIRRFTRFTCCSDEMFLGTVIVNSAYKDQIFHPYRSPIGHMRLIDRDRPEKASPHTFTKEDWPMIQQSPCFWARKFNEQRDPEIIERVFSTWKP